ncbi:MAG: peptidase M48 [Flavobacteriales bacterium]|nr:MAG: peptidase M48 [Flavobacteriales bacterium]
MKKIFLSLAILLFLYSCKTVPITGRKQLNLVSDQSLYPMAFQQYEGFLKENKLSNNAKKTAEIRAVGSRIASAVDRFLRANDMADKADAYKWEFNLVEDETVNAWCMPGGKVVFYTGILPIAKNTDGIAAIMGHEVAHAFAGHGAERMSTGILQQAGGLAVALATSNQSPEQQQIWMTAYGVGSQVGVMLPFSRKHETEADKLGVVFMIMAGYNPEEAVNVWIRMKEKSGGNAPPEFLSTHPSNQTRIKQLRDWIPEARVLAKNYNAQTLKK